MPLNRLGFFSESNKTASLNNFSINQKNKEGQNLRERLGPKVFYNQNKPRNHIDVSEIDSEEAVIEAITKNLQEPKKHVISKFKNLSHIIKLIR